jgi:hypothetical protein
MQTFLQITHHLRWESGSQGIKHCQHVNHFLSDRPDDWTEMSSCRKAHANHNECHTANGTLQRDRSHAAADVHELVDLLERVVHDDNARGFCCNVTVLANCHAHRSGEHRGRVIDSVADIQSFRLGSFVTNNREFLLGTLFCVDFADTDLLGQRRCGMRNGAAGVLQLQ